MKTHTNAFKEELKKFGRQITGKVYYYNNFNINTEDDDTILTENNIELVSEQFNRENPVEIDSDLIYSMNIIKNGNLLQSLMKEFDFEAKYELNVGTIVNPHFGLYVNEDYEYLNYGDFVIYSKEYNLDTETWSYVCYDMMLYSMIKYVPMSYVSYPITIRDYISAIANKMGIDFINQNDEFVNYNQLINEELFENQGYTFRDILDKLSQITASNIIVNDNNELELKYVNETNDTIDEQYLKDINVSFSETFGPINRISIADSENNLEYYAEDVSSIVENEKTQINIVDNEIAFNGEEQTICQNIFNKLNGLYYSLNDFSTTGICYYDFLDLYNIEAKGNSYQCLLLNDEINIGNGIDEKIFTEEPEDTEKSSNNYDTSIISNKAVQFKINQQDKKLEQAVMEDNIVASLNLAIEDGQGIVELKGNTVTIESDNFKLDEEGNVKCKSGTFENCTITGGIFNLLSDESNPKFIIKSTYASGLKGEFSDNGIYYTNEQFNNNYKSIMNFYNYGASRDNIDVPMIDMRVINENTEVQKYVGQITPYSCAFVERDNSGNISSRTVILSESVTTPVVIQTSKEEDKKNFEKFNKGLETIKNVDIYKYHLKGQNDNEKKHIGFVIGDKYNYSNEITAVNENGQEIGVDVYSMASVCLQAIKEQQEIIENLQKRIEKLESKESDK